MNKFTLYAILFLIVNSFNLSAQGLENPYKSKHLVLVNPAASGTYPGINNYAYYQTWSTLAKSPERFFVMVDAALNTKSGVAASLSKLNEGLISYTNLKLNFSQVVDLSKRDNLAFGFSMGLVNRRLDLDKIRSTNPNDPVLLSGLGKSLYFNSGFGLEYTYDKKFKLGLSLPNLYDGEDEEFKLNSVLYSLYEIDLENNWSLEPSVFLNYANTGVFSSDFYLNFDYDDTFWFTLGGSTKNSYFGGIGYSFSPFQFEYSYSLHNGTLKEISSSMHQLGISYLIVFNRLKRSWKR